MTEATISHRPRSQRTGSPDDFQTPESALVPLIPFLRQEWTIWEPACGKGNLVRGFERAGFSVIGSDVKDGRSYLDWQPDCWDCAVTNVPFSIKQKFLSRAYQLGKPFAFLLPLTTFEGRERQRLFREHGVEVILFPRRVNFETPSGEGSNSWFATAWFTYGLCVGQALTFWDGSEQLGLRLEAP